MSRNIFSKIEFLDDSGEWYDTFSAEIVMIKDENVWTVYLEQQINEKTKNREREFASYAQARKAVDALCEWFCDHEYKALGYVGGA